MSNSAPKLGLYITCLLDLTRPSAGFAMARLLEQTGAEITIPPQSCCGQPAYNNGSRKEAIKLAKTTLEAFGDVEKLIVPSASCAGMIRYHYPALLQDEALSWREQAADLAAKTLEFTDYLANLSENAPEVAEFNGRIGFHESCSARREMKVTGARKLLGNLKGSELIDLPGNEECCGFGGLFSVKFDEISNAMVANKCRKIIKAAPDLITGVDLGCLMNISGKLRREGANIPVYHIAELLDGDLTAPSI